MKADVLIFAAGLGTRLRPLTNDIPKPLIEVNAKTLLERNLELVAKAGFKRVIINLHYKKDKIKEFVKRHGAFGLEVIFSEEENLLNTGGTIKDIETYLEQDNLITINSDIILGDDFSLVQLLENHRNNQSKPLATLVLREDRDSKKYGELCVDKEGRICKFLNVEYFSNELVKCLMYTGVQVISRSLLSYMPKRGEVFSITQDTYVELLKQKKYLASIQYDGYWTDIGTLERLEQAREHLSTKIRKKNGKH